MLFGLGTSSDTHNHKLTKPQYETLLGKLSQGMRDGGLGILDLGFEFDPPYAYFTYFTAGFVLSSNSMILVSTIIACD